MFSHGKAGNFYFLSQLHKGGKCWEIFKPKINVVKKRWIRVLPFTFKLRWTNIWCKMRSRKEMGFMWALWNKAIALNTWRLKVKIQSIKLTHCEVMEKNPCYIDFGSVVMHNRLGNTHKTLCVSLPMITNHHGWLPPYIGNNVILLAKVQSMCNLWRTYGPC
jgi:hypothetical protein